MLILDFSIYIKKRFKEAGDIFMYNIMYNFPYLRSVSFVLVDNLLPKGNYTLKRLKRKKIPQSVGFNFRSFLQVFWTNYLPAVALVNILNGSKSSLTLPVPVAVQV